MPKYVYREDSKDKHQHRHKSDREWQPPYNAAVGVESAVVVDRAAVKEAIAELDALIRDTTTELKFLIGAALTTAHLSWQDVGDALGVKRQSAYDRFKGARNDVRLSEDMELHLAEMLGVESLAVVYEARDPDDLRYVAAESENPADMAEWLDEYAIYKVYPDGEERLVSSKDIAAYAYMRAKKGAIKEYIPNPDDEPF